MTVNALRKSSKDDEVISLSKTLIKNWKKFLSGINKFILMVNNFPIFCNLIKCFLFIKGLNKDTKDANASSNTKRKDKKLEKNKEESEIKKEKDVSDHRDNKMNDKVNKDLNKKQSSFPSSTTTDAVRLKCRELLASALQVEGNTMVGCASPEELAEELEEAIFGEFRNTDNKYRNRVSTIFIGDVFVTHQLFNV